MLSRSQIDPAAQGVQPQASSAHAGPRLGIFHLMLWTLCSAVFLTVSRAVQEMQGSVPDALVRPQEFASLIQCLTKGGVLTGVLVLGWNRIQREAPLMNQPGHWLLLGQAVALIYWPVSFLLLWQQLTDWPVLLLYIAISVSTATILAYASFRISPWSWRILFLFLAGLGLLQALLFLFLVVTPSAFSTNRVIAAISILLGFGRITVSVGMMILTIKDLVSRQFRDWLHWIGVVAFIIDATTGLLWWAFNVLA